MRIAGNGEKYMHNKFCLIDVLSNESDAVVNTHPVNGILINGSMNWTSNVRIFFRHFAFMLFHQDQIVFVIGLEFNFYVNKLKIKFNFFRVLTVIGRMFNSHPMIILNLNTKNHLTTCGRDLMKMVIAENDDVNEFYKIT